MELCPLSKVQSRIKLGGPLPFGIREPGGKLLLAREQVVKDEEQLCALIERGAVVNLDELRGPRAEVHAAPPELVPSLWRKLLDQVSRALLALPAPAAVQELDEAARYLAALVERSADLAIFLMVNPEHADNARYGVVRSLHAATAGWLIATRLNWPPERRLTLVKAAFTMNLGMLDLQERLAHQTRTLTPSQRQAIQSHPTASVTMLTQSGVVDPEWLQAVAQHHAKPGGGGYPAGLAEVAEMADALRIADVYTAKLAARAGREALLPGAAVRDLLAHERGNPFALAIVTEFGLYPPGAIVKLHSQELAAVVLRATETSAAQVAVLTGRRGEPLVAPVQREASGKEHGIAAPVPAKALKVRISAARLYAKARF